MEFFTIGVYNSSEEEYFNKLINNDIDTFFDIRQRRGVRGSQYAFVNSTRLQGRLGELKIRYGHIIQLAPTLEIRKLQKEVDKYNMELKRNRNILGSNFVDAFQEFILNKFDFVRFTHKLNEEGASKIVFFCVEEIPEACHRSLITNKLKELGYKITHL